MPDRFVTTHISQIPLFRDLPREQIDLLSTVFEVRRYEPGEVVFQQGHATSGMYKFVAGQAVMIQIDPQTGQEHYVRYVQPGDILKEEVLFRDAINTASLVVQEQALILHLPRRRFMELVAHHPEIKQSLGLVNRTDHHVHDVHFKGQRGKRRSAVEYAAALVGMGAAVMDTHAIGNFIVDFGGSSVQCTGDYLPAIHRDSGWVYGVWLHRVA